MVTCLAGDRQAGTVHAPGITGAGEGAAEARLDEGGTQGGCGEAAYRDDKARPTLPTLPDLLVGQSGPYLVVRADSTTIDGLQALLMSNNPYRMDDPTGLGRRDRLDSGVPGVLAVRIDNARQAALLLRGGHAPGLTALTAREVVIDADAPTVPAGIDGEALEAPTPVDCRIRPGAPRVRVPRRRPGVLPAKPPMDWRRVRRMALTMARTAAGRDAA